MAIFKIKVTKELAQEWLTKNQSNRGLHRRHVEFLRRQMNDGLWMYSADPIKFSGNYVRLIDGQHRLTAFIESELLELEFLIATDLEDQSFHVFDTGRPRSAKDVLHIEGYQYSGRIAAVVKTINIIESGRVIRTVRGGEMKSQSSTTNHEVFEFAENHPELTDIVKQAEAWYGRFPALKPAEYGAFYYIFAKSSQDQAFSFFQDLSSGLNLTEDNPVYLLRKKLELDKISSTRMVARMRHSLMVLAWNAYKLGKSVKRLTYKPGDELPGIL